jgi:fucose permease
MAQSSETQDASRLSRVPRIHMALAFLAFILIGCNDGGLGVLIPSLRAFYHVDAFTFSWLFFASVIGYLIASFNTGLLTANWVSGVFSCLVQLFSAWEHCCIASCRRLPSSFAVERWWVLV